MKVFMLAILAALSFAVLANADDAIDEVNAERASYGLPPYVRDEYLSRAAESAAGYRAANLIQGHTANDFNALVPGDKADAAGCAAWSTGGWGACETYGGYAYAGAAVVIGRDGRRYMHLFVRGQGYGFTGEAASNAAGHQRIHPVATVVKAAAMPVLKLFEHPTAPAACTTGACAPTPNVAPGGCASCGSCSQCGDNYGRRGFFRRR